MKFRKIRNMLPSSINQVCDKVYTKYLYKYREQKKHYGQLYPEKTFYVVRSVVPMTGALHDWLDAALKVDYAIKKGYIPIVDYQNYHAEWVDGEIDCDKTKNCWDIFFRQPFPQYSLEEVYQSKNVILGSGDQMDKLWFQYDDRESCQYYHNIFEKYIPFNSHMQDLIEEAKKKYFHSEDRILGISLRRELEAGFARNDPWYVNHPAHKIRNTLLDGEEAIDKYMSKFQCNKVFVACDDVETCEYLESKYGESIIIYERVRAHYWRNGKLTDQDTIYNELYTEQTKRTEGYIVETCLLSMCTSIIGINTSSNTMACIMNNYDYENVV